MTRGVLNVLCLLLVALPCAAPRADIDVAEYEVRGAVRSEQQRKKLNAQFERDRQEEQAREKKQQEELARQEAERQAALAARPYPLRLTEARCTVCHAATHFSQQRHTWPGWFAVVLRMKYFNHAPIESVDIPVIAGHLAYTYGASGVDALLEYLLPLATVALPAGAGWLLRRRLRRRGSAA